VRIACFRNTARRIAVRTQYRSPLHGVTAASVRKITGAYCTQCRPPAYSRNGHIDRARLGRRSGLGRHACYAQGLDLFQSGLEQIRKIASR
jgi:hypothetical protein